MKAQILLLVCGILLASCGLSRSQETDPEPTPTPTPADWFDCPDDGYFPHPYDCEKYFVCTNDLAWLFTCPANLWFDTVELICDRPDNVVCTATPTKSMNQN